MMAEAAIIFAICIPLAALIFGAVSIRNQDVRMINESLRYEVAGLNDALKKRDLAIIDLKQQVEHCMDERMNLMERLLRVERSVEGEPK